MIVSPSWLFFSINRVTVNPINCQKVVNMSKMVSLSACFVQRTHNYSHLRILNQKTFGILALYVTCYLYKLMPIIFSPLTKPLVPTKRQPARLKNEANGAEVPKTAVPRVAT